jgi:chromosome partitioning protein
MLIKDSTDPAKILPRISASDVAALAAQAQSAFMAMESVLLAPDRVKQPPRYGTAMLAQLLGMDASKLRYLLGSRPDLPQGHVAVKGGARDFSVAEIAYLSKELRVGKSRPEGKNTFVLVIGHFKGGVGKTTTSASIAHGLSLRGHSVLVIDCDPQGSMSQLFGVNSTDFNNIYNLRPFFAGEEETLDYAIKPTYWPNIDLISGGPTLFLSESDLPTRQMQLGAEFKFYSELDRGITALNGKYDFIVIDTPPSMSFMTMNCYAAAHGLLMPLPPSGLDFASSVHFWNLLSYLLSEIESFGGKIGFDCIGILPSKILSGKDTQSQVRTQTEVRGMMQEAFGQRITPFDLPETKMADRAGTLLGSIFELSQYGDIDRRSIQRAMDAYSRVVEWVEDQALINWERSNVKK